MGNLTRDPELSYTPGGTAAARLGIACNRQWIDRQTNQKREEVTFVECVLWGKTAEIAQKYCTKGSPVFLEGRLKTS